VEVEGLDLDDGRVKRECSGRQRAGRHTSRVRRGRAQQVRHE